MRKSHLIKIIREEIRKTISEGQLKDSLQKNFPSIIDYERNKNYSEFEWEVISNEQLDKNEISKFQDAVGYSPMAYGGPFKFDEEKLPDGNFKYTWTSWSSS